MKSLNLETRFDSDLRDIPVEPDDFKKAIVELEKQLNSSIPLAEQVKLFGLLGTYQRILGLLEQAETNFEKAISLSSSLNQTKLKLTNLIRLGHTKHWMKDYLHAHRIFDECNSIICEDISLEVYLDLVHQHRGKCYFDERKYHLALNEFYKAMLIRNNKSESNLVDNSLSAVQETKRRWLPQVSDTTVQILLSDKRLPSYVKNVIGKKHGVDLELARLNCINAAFNFHGLKADNQSPLKPIELLNILYKQTDQVQSLDDFHFGDLVVWWNRNSGTWENKKISIKEMNFLDPNFPFGLIFDHVAIRVTNDIVFNKPNPSPSSEYRFDYLDTASYPSKLGVGYEMTLHRLRKS